MGGGEKGRKAKRTRDTLRVAMGVQVDKDYVNHRKRGEAETALSLTIKRPLENEEEKKSVSRP